MAGCGYRKLYLASDDLRTANHVIIQWHAGTRRVAIALAGVAGFTPGPVFQEYLAGYARHFGILGHIRFGCTVLNLPEAEPGAGFRITYNDGSDDKSRALILLL